MVPCVFTLSSHGTPSWVPFYAFYEWYGELASVARAMVGKRLSEIIAPKRGGYIHYENS